MNRLIKNFENKKEQNYERLLKEEKEALENIQKYELLNTEKSCCPWCNKPVDLLRNNDTTSPAFFICFPCRFVAQVGVGPITLDELDKAIEEVRQLPEGQRPFLTGPTSPGKSYEIIGNMVNEKVLEMKYEMEQVMSLDDSIDSLNYLFNYLIRKKQPVSLNLYGGAFIPKCNLKSVQTTLNSYEIEAVNGTCITFNPKQIRMIRFDAIPNIVTTFEGFKSSLAEAELQTGNYDFMIHFMIHDQNQGGGFLLTVKVLKSS